MRLNVHQQVLRLDIPVTDALAVDVRQRPEHLVHVQLDQEDRHALVRPHIMLVDLVHGVGNVLEDQVEVQVVRVSVGRRLVRSRLGRRGRRRYRRRPARRVETVLQQHHVGMVQLSYDLQLPVLEPPVLEHLLYRHNLVRIDALRLEHHPKRSITHNFQGLVSYGLHVAPVVDPVRAVRRDCRLGPGRVALRHLAFPHRLPPLPLCRR